MSPAEPKKSSHSSITNLKSVGAFYSCRATMCGRCRLRKWYSTCSSWAHSVWKLSYLLYVTASGWAYTHKGVMRERVKIYQSDALGDMRLPTKCAKRPTGSYAKQSTSAFSND